MSRVVSKVILLILMITAEAGWLIFAAGFGIFYKQLSPSDAPLPVIIGVSWKAVLSPMILFGGSAIPLYVAAIIRIFLQGRKEKILSSIIMLLHFFYMLGLSTTLFILAMLLVGGLGDYLKNIFMLTQNNILVMASGCLVSAIPYWAHMVIWPLTQISRQDTSYMYQELVQN